MTAIEERNVCGWSAWIGKKRAAVLPKSTKMGHDGPMDYDLYALGNRQFEHLSQSLARQVIGASLGVFGDGPDGGREATWEGTISALGEAGQWSGRGVLQAKAKAKMSSASANLNWLKGEITKEAKAWTAPDGNRGAPPDYLLIVTNVNLSAVPGSGIDAASRHLIDAFKTEGVDLKGAHIWHYDEIRVLLDAHESVRRTYRAWITPGDILSQLLDSSDGDEVELRRALYAHAARSLEEDNQLNLTQAGSARDNELTVPEVFVDLPFDLPSALNDPESMEEWVRTQRPHAGATSILVARADEAFPDRRSNSERTDSRRTVLVGGPGQGKSTVTQYLAQVYRAEFLRDTDLARQNGTVAQALKVIAGSAERIGLNPPKARRWPIRIVMTKLADALSSGESGSLIDFLAQQVSYRSSVSISAKGLRWWLEQYPWLLIIDGLDEVPDSSNRAQVLTAISDFFIEVDTFKADVVVVTTTRPQGYNEEFDPDYYCHITLSQLKLQTAITFAESFIRLRVGPETDRCAELVKKFHKAAVSEAGSRLLGSPLQVTIFVVLIERQGKAPGDRSRLFSAYYRVILHREQEKDGPLAEMLREFEGDIDFLHRRVGHMLHEKSAEAGGTSATLDRAEFEEVIARRLRSEGHGPRRAELLSKEFVSLATERLVFLTFQTSSRVGFEIRSLQEFMAAEWIVARKEKSVISKIHEIARDPHWKNVVLFALGHIFTQKERLRPAAVLLCQELDADSRADISIVGAELALTMLLDGAPANQPRIEASLAWQAVRLLDGPPTVTSMKFASLLRNSTDVREVLRKTIDTSLPLTKSALVNRLIVLGQFADDELDIGDVLYGKIRLDPKRFAPEVLYVASMNPPGCLGHLATELVESIGPSSIAEAVAKYSSRDRVSDRGADGPWVLRLFDAISKSGARVEGIQSMKGTDDWISMAWNPVGHEYSSWSGLAEQMPSDEAWHSLRSLAEFMVAPNADALARALESVAKSTEPWDAIADERHLIYRGASWPLASLIKTARQVAAANCWGRDDVGRWLEEVAAIAKRGGLGDAESWIADERDWSAIDYSFDSFAAGPGFSYGDLEFELIAWPNMSRVGIHPATMVFYMTPDFVPSDAIEVLTALHDSRDRLGVFGRHEVDDLIVFLCSNLVRELDEPGEDVLVEVVDVSSGALLEEVQGSDMELADLGRKYMVELIEFAVASAHDSRLGYSELGWLRLFDLDGLRHDVGVGRLGTLGSIRSRVHERSSPVSSALLDLYAEDPLGGLLWLAFWFDPDGFVSRVRNGSVSIPHVSQDRSCDQAMHNYVALLLAPKDDILSGKMSDRLVDLWHDSGLGEGPRVIIDRSVLFWGLAIGLDEEDMAAFDALMAALLLDLSPSGASSFLYRRHLR